MVRDHHGEPTGAHYGPHRGQHGRPYGAHKSIIPKASTATVFMGAHGPDSLCCCSDGGSWAWSRGVGGNIGLIPHTSRNTSPPICLPLIQMKRVSHHACTNPLMHVRNDIEQLANINMYITLMNNGATESEDEIHPLTVTCT